MIAWLGIALLGVSTSPGTVRLHLGECVPDRDLVHDFVAIELGFQRLVEADATFEVWVTCGESAIDVKLDPNPLDVEARQVILQDVTAGGPRLVALNIVELIQDASTQRKIEPLKSDAPIATVEEPQSASVTPSIAGRIGLAPMLRLLPDPVRAAYGARLHGGIDFPMASGVGATLWLDAGYEDSSASVDLGTVHARAVSASVQGGASVELGADFTFFALIGVRGGWAWLTSKSRDPGFDGKTAEGPWFGPLLGLRLRFGGLTGIALGIEGGWTVYRAFADEIGLQGGWFGTDLALDFSFGSG